MQFPRRALVVGFAFTILAVVGTRCALAASTAVASDRDMAALATKPVSLPDMALGSLTAPITIVEYSSLTCPHCADFAENVFPMLRAKYIDTGKVRFVSREFPLDVKAAAASMLARCAAGGDASKFFEVTMMLFKQQQDLVEHTTGTLTAIGAKFGMAEPEVEKCVKSDTALDKLQADQTFAYNQLKVGATPTFFINGEKVTGSMSFEALEAKLLPLLKQ